MKTLEMTDLEAVELEVIEATNSKIMEEVGDFVVLGINTSKSIRFCDGDCGCHSSDCASCD